MGGGPLRYEVPVLDAGCTHSWCRQRQLRRRDGQLALLARRVRATLGIKRTTLSNLTDPCRRRESQSSQLIVRVGLASL